MTPVHETKYVFPDTLVETIILLERAPIHR